MANMFKSLTANDVAQTRSILNAAVPLDGAIVNYTSTYGTYPANTNVKAMPNGMLQRIYDYIYTASSSNHVMDITLGVHADSVTYDLALAATTSPFVFEQLSESWVYDDTIDAYKTKKNNMYNMLAQVLMGFDENGDIRKFDMDGNFVTTGDKLNEIMAINFSRLTVKDEIKKGSFNFILGMNPDGYDGVGGTTTPVDTFKWDGTTATNSYVKISDYGAATNYKVNSPAGEYAILYAQNTDATGVVYTDTGYLGGGVVTAVRPLYKDTLDSDYKTAIGLIFYQAGVVILSPWLFAPYNSDLYTAGKYGYLTPTNLVNYRAERLLFDSNGVYSVPTPPINFYSILNFVCGYEFLSELIISVSNRRVPAGGGNWAIGGGTDWTSPAGGLVHTPGAGTDDVTLPNVRMIAGSIDAGTKYLISYRVTASAAPAETIQPMLGAVAGVATAAPTGMYHQKITAGVNDVDLTFRASPAFDGTINDISITMLDELDIDISIDDFADAFRQRFYSIDFVNSTELNSSIYFCRLNHNDFNYSANPTYTTDSKINVKQTSTDLPISYITGVELYSPDGEMMARGKLSEPLKKDAATSLTLRARLDY